jgi:hypothetical protein
VLRKIFGPKRDKVTGEWTKLQKELYGLYSSPNITWVIKSGRMRCSRHAACMGARKGAYMVFVGKGVDGRIILKSVFKKWEGGMDWIDLAQERDRW